MEVDTTHILSKSGKGAESFLPARMETCKGRFKGGQVFISRPIEDSKQSLFHNEQFHLEKEEKIAVHHGSTLCEVFNDGKGRKVRAEQALSKKPNEKK